MAKKLTPQQRFTLLNEYKKKVKQMCPNISTRSGIYLFYRFNEEKEFCVYVGQAKNLLERTAQHFLGRQQHIDRSLFDHKTYNKYDNPYGWELSVLNECDVENLDKEEQRLIEYYLSMGAKVYNVTGGGQIDKKQDIGERQQTKLKSYKNGKIIAEKKAKLYVKTMFDKYLDFCIKPPTNKLKERKFEEFKNYLEGTDEDKEN